MPPKVKRSNFKMNGWRIKSTQIGFKQFQKIDQEFSAFCKTETDNSNMSVAALDSHAAGKKHKQIANATVSSASAAISAAMFCTGKLDYMQDRWFYFYLVRLNLLTLNKWIYWVMKLL